MNLDICMHAPMKLITTTKVLNTFITPKISFFCGLLLLLFWVRTFNMIAILLIYFKVHNTILLTIQLDFKV